MTTNPATEASVAAPPTAALRVRTGRHHRVTLAAASVAAAGGVGIGLVAASAEHSQQGRQAPAATATAPVTYRTLASQQLVNGNLGFSGSYSVVNQASGTLTGLPSPGRVVTQGQALYQVDASQVILLYGAIPAYRGLTEGDSGPDVRNLNADLVALHDATGAGPDSTSDYFGAATVAAVDRLQQSLGLPETGSLALGQAVFLPGPIRVTSVPVTPGTAAEPGAVVLQATSTTPDVTVSLDAALQGDIQTGDEVTITMPDQRTTIGTVTTVSTVATTGSPGQSGSPGGSAAPASSGGNPQSATIQVTISLRDPAATGTLDQAPMQVAITTATAPRALTVPVTALLARPGGGYGVEVIGPRNSRRIVPVSVGLFDDTVGLVQVTGLGLHAGQRVVVPAAP